MSVAAKTRENTVSVRRKHKFSVEIEGTCVSKYFDEIVCLQSEIRREWIREIRGERLQGIAEGASSNPRPASSSAASLPGRNKCPGTHCSLIEQEEREGRSANGGKDRKRVRYEDKRSGRLVGAAETSK